MRIGVVDLFCGVGGLTNGLKQSKLKVKAGFDLDLTCKYSYEVNNKAKFIHKDINDIHGAEITKLLKNYDVKVLVGCAPCQPFSKHQKDKKNRMKHKDWKLLYQFQRLVEEVNPEIVSMENVPELTKETVFIDFVNSLKKLNYYVSFSVVDISDYGIAQRRKRLILLASKLGEISLIPPTHKDKKNTVRNVIGNLPPITAGEICSTDVLHRSSELSDLNLRRIRASKPNGTWRDWPEDLILKCHKKKTGKTYSSVYGRMGWDNLAPTITTQFTSYGTGRFGHPDQDRALSLREGAMLQSFPASYKFLEENKEFCMGEVARHIGNAVPPRLGEVIGITIQNHVKRYTI